MVIGIIVVVALVLLMVSRLSRFYGRGLPKAEHKPTDLSAFSRTNSNRSTDAQAAPTSEAPSRPGASNDDHTP